MKILALSGSPRENGNSTLMLNRFLTGFGQSGGEVNSYKSSALNILPCTGCLRCNLIKRCSLRGDDWERLSTRILEADVIAVSTPVYFFTFPSEIKKVIDRFRSFIHVRITENGLIHTPWAAWNKKFVLFLSMGSPDPREGEGLIRTMRFIVNVLGEENTLFHFSGTRLAVGGQIGFDEEKLRILYEKLGIPAELADPDAERNRKLMAEILSLGTELGAGG